MFYSSQNRVRPFLTTAASAARAAATAIVFCLGASGDDFRLANHCFGHIAKAIFHFDQIADVQIGNHMDSGVGVQALAFTSQVEVVVEHGVVLRKPVLLSIGFFALPLNQCLGHMGIGDDPS